MNRLKTDVLVLGGGAAGIRAAAEAVVCGADVLLVNSLPVTTSGSTFSPISRGWGIQALLAGERSHDRMESFYNEIIAVGQGICDPELSQILVEESGDRVQDLIDYGIRFKRSEDRNYFRAKGCFSDTERALITSDFDNVQAVFRSILQQYPVKMVTGTAIDLIVRDGICGGALVMDKHNDLIQIGAKATILAMGGGGAIYEHHLCDPESTGDGYALAIRAGAQLIHMEFIQFMLGLADGRRNQFLPRHMLYNENVIVDGWGKPVLESCIPDATQRQHAVSQRQNHCPASACDDSFLIDRSIWETIHRTGSVFWNSDKEVVNRASVVHMAHAFNGGIRIDARAAASLPGLFAAGETAAGPHGADRIGGCMMTATQVFGKRAGASAAEYAGRVQHAEPLIGLNDPFPVLKSEGDSKREKDLLVQLEKTVKQAMRKYVNVVRSKSRLATCRRLLSDAGSRLTLMGGASPLNYLHYNKVRNIIDVAEQITQAAQRRKGVCGSHYRADEELTA